MGDYLLNSWKLALAFLFLFWTQVGSCCTWRAQKGARILREGTTCTSWLHCPNSPKFLLVIQLHTDAVGTWFKVLWKGAQMELIYLCLSFTYFAGLHIFSPSSNPWRISSCGWCVIFLCGLFVNYQYKLYVASICGWEMRKQNRHGLRFVVWISVTWCMWILLLM